MSALTDWRSALATRVATAVGWPAFSNPPASLTPPAVVILIGGNYVVGPRRTGCLVDATVVVRLVTAIHEQDSAFDELDDALEAALGVLAAFETVNVGARTYGGSRYWCADITVTEPAALPPALTRRQPVDAVPRE